MAEHQDLRRARFIFLWMERASCNRLDSEHWKKSRRRISRFESLRFAFASQVKSLWDIHEGGHFRKTDSLAPEILKIAGRIRHLRKLREVRVPYLNESARVAVRKWTKQNVFH